MRRAWVEWKVATATALCLIATTWTAASSAQEMPKLVTEQGRATLMVDGQPYFLLGAQVDNSSGWPDRLSAVWPAVEKMRMNTLEVPVYWEQMEPVKGTYDFTVVDTVLHQARAHKTRLVLLWFGTWKNGKMHYVPDWVKVGHGHVSADEVEGGHAHRCAQPQRPGKSRGRQQSLRRAHAPSERH
jgi:hypothetical protein